MDDAFVALRIVNDLLDQVFVCQAPVHCIEQQRKIFLSDTKANRVSDLQASQNTPLGSQGTEL